MKVKNDNKIKTFKSGLKKDNFDSKVRFDLIPYELLYRIAEQFTEGAYKYGENNWKNADKTNYMIFMQAGLRHVNQWADKQTDEDHAVAAITNIIMYEYLKKRHE